MTTYFQDELEKMQRALNQSYADRDKLALEADKIRDDLERSQVECNFFTHANKHFFSGLRTVHRWTVHPWTIHPTPSS